jgi:hypothetical protein
MSKKENKAQGSKVHLMFENTVIRSNAQWSRFRERRGRGEPEARIRRNNPLQMEYKSGIVIA